MGYRSWEKNERIDWGDWAIKFLVVGVVLFFVWMGFYFFKQEWDWNNAKIEQLPATLLSQQYNPSTQTTDLVPVYTSKGFGMGVSSSGDPESYITLWDTKEGRLKVNNKEVWRYAKPESILLITRLNDEFRVVGIQH